MPPENLSSTESTKGTNRHFCPTLNIWRLFQCDQHKKYISLVTFVVWAFDRFKLYTDELWFEYITGKNRTKRPKGLSSYRWCLRGFVLYEFWRERFLISLLFRYISFGKKNNHFMILVHKGLFNSKNLFYHLICSCNAKYSFHNHAYLWSCGVTYYSD